MRTSNIRPVGLFCSRPERASKCCRVQSRRSKHPLSKPAPRPAFIELERELQPRVVSRRFNGVVVRGNVRHVVSHSLGLLRLNPTSLPRSMSGAEVEPDAFRLGSRGLGGDAGGGARVVRGRLSRRSCSAGGSRSTSGCPPPSCLAASLLGRRTRVRLEQFAENLPLRGQVNPVPACASGILLTASFKELSARNLSAITAIRPFGRGQKHGERCRPQAVAKTSTVSANGSGCSLVVARLRQKAVTT